MSKSGQLDSTQVVERHMVPEEEKDPQRGRLDPQYYKGLPGLLKLLETVLSFVAYIPLAVSPFYCVWATDGFFKTIALSAFISILIRWILLVIRIRLWMPFELGFYGIVVLLLLFADIFLSVHGCTGYHTASTIFGWFALVPFGIDGFIVARRFFDPERPPEPRPTLGFIELGFYGIVVLLLLFADIFLSVHGCTRYHTASTVFGWFALVPFGIDGFLVARRFFDPERPPEPRPTLGFIVCI